MLYLQNRALSPITELITPTSLRTITLPPIEHHDYDSEYEGDPPSPGGTVRSNHAEETLTPRAGDIPLRPDRPVIVRDPLGRSGTTLIEPSHSSFPGESFVSLSVATRSSGLPPSHNPIGSGSMHRSMTPGTANSYCVGGQATQPYADQSPPGHALPISQQAEEEVHPGIAGVGTRGTRRSRSHIRSRPSSFHAGVPDLLHTQPGEVLLNTSLSPPQGVQSANVAQRFHPAWYDVPFLPIAQAGELGTTSPNKTPSPEKPPVAKSPTPTRRPSSLKKRPATYHGSRSGSIASRSNSQRSRQGSDVSLVTGMSAAGSEIDARESAVKNGPRRPILATHWSDSSLPRQTWLSASLAQPDASPPTRRRSPTRRRTVSSIFSSLFGHDPTSTSESLARRLSRRRARTNSRHTPPPPEHIPEPFLEGQSLEEPKTAIRTSGTFGIRDDGSEIQGEAEDLTSPRTVLFRPRTYSENGSVRSIKVKRVLYVNNVDHVTEGSEEAEDTPQRMPNSDGSDRKEVSSRPDSRSPIAAKANTEMSEGQSNHAREAQRHRRSFSSPIARTAMFVPLEAPLCSMPRRSTPPPLHGSSAPPLLAEPIAFDLPSFTPSIGPGIASTDSAYLALLEANQVPRGMLLDDAKQTSGTTSSVRRPLPFPPTRPASVTLLANGGIPSSNGTRTDSSGQKSRPASIGTSPLSHDIRTPRNSPFLHIPPPPAATPSPRPRDTTMSEQLSYQQTAPRPIQPECIPLVDQTSDQTHTQATAGEMSTGAMAHVQLLIASHLFSTHAAALMRHSTMMKDVSEIMHKMAQESLDWAVVLLKMTRENDESPPRRRSESSTDDSAGSHLRPMSSSDPVNQAWVNLHGDLTRDMPEPLRNGLSPHPAPNPSPSHPGTPGSPPEDHFSPIPVRPSVNRLRSRCRVGEDEDKRSLMPAALLGEADRLGREGWDNIPRAEEAWRGAMTSLSELVDRQTSDQQPSRPSVPTVSADDPQIRTSPPIPPAQTRSSQASMDTTRGTTQAYHSSFLPTEAVMEARPDRAKGDLYKAARILGPNSGILDMVPPGIRRSTERRGYTDEDLGIASIGKKKDRPVSGNTSHTARSRGGGKLSKRKAQVGSSLQGRVTEGSRGPGIGDADTKRGKKHWWSRKGRSCRRGVGMSMVMRLKHHGVNHTQLM